MATRSSQPDTGRRAAGPTPLPNPCQDWPPPARVRRTESRGRGGVIVLGGPIDDVRVVLVIEAESEETVRDILARDPWSETHLVVDTVDTWSVRLDGRKGRR